MSLMNRPCPGTVKNDRHSLKVEVELQSGNYFFDIYAAMPNQKRGAGIAFTLLLSSSAGAVEFDVFGRVLAEHNMIPAKSNVCSTQADIDAPPRLLQGVRPLYPVDSILSRNSGAATIRYRVGVDGKTTVLSSDTKGPAEARKWFGNHAIIAVGSWTFTPGQRAGEPVPVDCAIEFRFGED